MRVRPARPHDAEAMGRVHVTAWGETYRGLVPQPLIERLDSGAYGAMWARYVADPLPGRAYFVGEHEGGVVALAGAGPARPPAIAGVTGEFMLLYVLRQAQGLGLGRGLMQAMAAHLLAGGHRSAVAWVIAGNARAESFYGRLGGVPGPLNAWDSDGATIRDTGYVFADLASLAR